MTTLDYIKLGVGVFCFLYSLITTIVAIIKAKKNKNNEELKKLLTSELIPLMEEAENKLNYTGEDKEQWVIKKLADKLHIDLFKYKKVLALIKSIIADICSTTKIAVNNIVVKDGVKSEVSNEKEIY